MLKQYVKHFSQDLMSSLTCYVTKCQNLSSCAGWSVLHLLLYFFLQNVCQVSHLLLSFQFAIIQNTVSAEATFFHYNMCYNLLADNFKKLDAFLYVFKIVSNMHKYESEANTRRYCKLPKDIFSVWL